MHTSDRETAGLEIPESARRPGSFRGEWAVTGTMRTGGIDAAVSGAWRFDGSADGWGVLGLLATRIEGWGTMEEAELIGLDAGSGEIHLFSMNRFVVRDHTGGWVDRDVLRVRHVGTSGAAAMSEEITIDFTDPDRAVATVVEEEDGAVTITADLVLTGVRSDVAAEQSPRAPGGPATPVGR